MNSYERVRAVLEHKTPDTVPVAPFLGVHTAVVAGVPIGRYLCSAETMAQAQSYAADLYNQDAVLVNGDNYYIAEGFGTRATHYPNATPTFLAPAIDSVFDAGKLRIPDPSRDGRMPVYLDALAILARKYKGKKFIRGCGTGPFSLASHLVGTGKFLDDVIDAVYEDDQAKLRAIHALMEKSCDALTAFAIAELRHGADMVQCGDSLASLDVISPIIYERIVLQYEKRYIESIRPYLKKYGAFSILHVCGNTTRQWKHFREIGFNCIEIDYKCDISAAKAAFAGRSAILGNIDPSAVLLSAAAKEVYAVCSRCIEAAAPGGGFLLGSGCDVAPNTPPENMMAMVRAARAYRYALQAV